MRAAALHLPLASLWCEVFLSVRGKFILIFPLFDTVLGNDTFRI